MAQPCCPTCGRALPKPKAVKVADSIDLATMTDEQLRAHYKKTAPVEDIRFALRVGVRLGTVAPAWEALLGLAPQLTAAEAKRRLVSLQGQWRRERNARESSAAFSARITRNMAYLVAQQAQREYLAPMREAKSHGRPWHGRPYRGRLNPERLTA